MPANEHVTMTFEEWVKKGTALFGADRLQWKFVCPVCGHVSSVQGWYDVGAADGEVAFSCVGRRIEGSKQAFKKKGVGPCTYAGGGLFRLNPVTVVLPDGQERDVFEFAEGASNAPNNA